MRQLIVLLTLIICAGAMCPAEATAKEKKQRTFRLWGHVKDKFTKVGIPDVKITLMDADSTVIDTMTVKHGGAKWAKDSWFYFDRPVTAARYIILAQHADYEDCYVDYEVKHVGRNTYLDAPWHLMKRKSPRQNMDKTLDELVVKGTRVKLAYKGDTLVFDAAAFKLPDGSMLDALIRQMPGVTLSDDGEITVNGRKVDYLLLNGKEFFKDNNKAMLENLPYYTVENISVYDKMTEKSQYIGRNIEEQDFVMDVKLKKEYNTGYLGNAEAGAATGDHWLGRLFGSRFTDHSNISAYVNLNNINERRNPSNNGDWNPSNAPVGRSTTRAAGVNLTIDDKDKRFAENLSITMRNNDSDNSSSSQTTRFMPSGNVYSMSDNHRMFANRDFSISNNFTLKIPLWVNVTTTFTVGDSESRMTQRNALLNRGADGYSETSEVLDSLFGLNYGTLLKEALVNRNNENTLNSDDNINFYQRVLINKRLAWGDNIEFEANANYEKKGSKMFADQRTDYYDGQTPADYRNIYQDQPYQQYRYYVRGEYYMNFLSKWTWRLYALYSQTNENQTNSYYRMEQLDGWLPGEQPLGTYPTDRQLLEQSLSPSDSYHQNHLIRNTQPGLHFYYDNRTDSGSVFLRFHLPMIIRNEKLAYQRGEVDTVARRTEVLIHGNINLNASWDGWRRRVNANFWHETILPSAYDKLNITDATDPLSVLIGNPRLKSEHRYRANASYYYMTKNNRLKTTVFAEGDYRANQILAGYSYNSQTGAYVYQKQNGKNRWYVRGYAGLTALPGKNQIWQIDLGCNTGYDKNEVSRLPAGASRTELYGTRTTTLNPTVNVKYNKGTLNTSLGGSLGYSSTDYDEPNTKGYHSGWYRLSYNLQYTIPVVGLQLATTLSWYSQSSSVEGMSTQEYLIWNVFLSRALLKDKSLVLKLNAFDLLNNVSHYSYYNYGDTFTTSRYERLSHYVMLSAVYNFKMNPRKSSGKE